MKKIPYQRDFLFLEVDDYLGIWYHWISVAERFLFLFCLLQRMRDREPVQNLMSRERFLISRPACRQAGLEIRNFWPTSSIDFNLYVQIFNWLYNL